MEATKRSFQNLKSWVMDWDIDYSLTMATGLLVHTLSILAFDWHHDVLQEPNLASWLFMISLLNFVANVRVSIKTEANNASTGSFSGLFRRQPELSMTDKLWAIGKFFFIIMLKVGFVNYVLNFLWLPINEQLFKLCHLTSHKLECDICSNGGRYTTHMVRFFQDNVFNVMRMSLTVLIMSKINNLPEKVASIYTNHFRPAAVELKETVQVEVTEAIEAAKVAIAEEVKHKPKPEDLKRPSLPSMGRDRKKREDKERPAKKRDTSSSLERLIDATYKQLPIDK